MAHSHAWAWRSIALAALVLLTAASWAKAQGTVEPDTDRPGADYRVFDMMAASPPACQTACREDRFCRAWTYVKPGVQAQSPRCVLKNAATPPTPNPCCVSGAIDRPFSPAAPPPPPEALPAPPADDRRSGQLEACEARIHAESPSADVVYAEMVRQARARGGPPPTLTEHALAAWLRDAIFLRCVKEIGAAQ